MSKAKYDSLEVAVRENVERIHELQRETTDIMVRQASITSLVRYGAFVDALYKAATERKLEGQLPRLTSIVECVEEKVAPAQKEGLLSYEKAIAMWRRADDRQDILEITDSAYRLRIRNEVYKGEVKAEYDQNGRITAVNKRDLRKVIERYKKKLGDRRFEEPKEEGCVPLPAEHPAEEHVERASRYPELISLIASGAELDAALDTMGVKGKERTGLRLAYIRHQRPKAE